MTSQVFHCHQCSLLNQTLCLYLESLEKCSHIDLWLVFSFYAMGNVGLLHHSNYINQTANSLHTYNTHDCFNFDNNPGVHVNKTEILVIQPYMALLLSDIPAVYVIKAKERRKNHLHASMYLFYFFYFFHKNSLFLSQRSWKF